jgi:hypothetical protein
MGGFVIFEGDDVPHVVTAEELDDLLKNSEIIITEKDIRDKGRGDALSKGLILIQTTWFILQCIPRKAAHLPITELELVTYAVWWYKPLNVGCPVRVYRQGKKKKEMIKLLVQAQVVGRGRREPSGRRGRDSQEEAGK